MHIRRDVPLKIKSNFLIICLAGFGLAVIFSGCASTSKSLKPNVWQEVYVDEFGNEYIVEYVEEYVEGDVDGEYAEGQIVILEEPSYEPPEFSMQDVTEEKTVIRKQPEAELPEIIKDKKDFSPPAGSQVHRVWIWQETGDCLWSIAKQYYGDPWKWKKIYMANQDTIDDPNIIFPKQILAIPPEQ